MSEQTTEPQAPTVTSNSQAAQLACRTERNRVLRLLAMAPAGSVPEPIMQAIEGGTPSAIFASNQRMVARKAQGSPGSPSSGSPAARSSWGAITAQFNARSRAAQPAQFDRAPAE